MADVRFSAQAYAKIMFHCAKYPNSAVNGVLLAKSVNPKDGTKSKVITFIDAVPLFHINIDVTPMAEIALLQIDHWAAQSKLAIAGYYVANENLEYSNSIEKSNPRIADKIAENYPQACFVVVDNSAFTFKEKNYIPLIVAQLNADNKWKETDQEKVSLVPTQSDDLTQSLMKVKAYKELIDFDNHLDDVKQSWKNEELNDQIELILKNEYMFA